MLAPVGLLKACSVVSAKLNYPRLSIFLVAPSREFKSQTSVEMTRIFSKNRYLDLGSDFTIHSLHGRYRERGMDRKCLMINDATLLFASKKANTKDRLVNALAELLSESKYVYGDRVNPKLTIEARISVIMNMTLESYNKYQSTLIGSTFLERFLTLFYSMPEEELTEFARKRDERMSMKFGNILSLRNISVVKVNKNYKKVLIDYAKEFSVLSVKSFNSCNDTVNAIVKSHAILNNRDYVCDDDIEILKITEKFLSNPFAPNESKIIKFYKQGKTYTDICNLLGRDEGYKSYISRVIKKAKERGVVN